MNALCGFAAIHFAARGMNEPHRLFLEKPELTFFAIAAWMIFLAMVADAFDGFVARRSGSTSDFGGQLDSLSDMVSFGVAPAFLMLRVVESGLNETIGQVSPLFGSLPGRILWLIAAIYVCCTALRLAKFNVENEMDEMSHMRFSGLPSPAAAGLVAALVLLYSDIGPEFREDVPAVISIGSKILIYSLPVLTLTVALLMVSNIPFAHVVNRFLKGRKSFGQVVLLVIVSLLIISKAQLTLAPIIMVYILWSVVVWLKRKFPKKVAPPVTEEHNETRL